MGSRFVEKIITKGVDKWNQPVSKPILAWFQFVPALVTDVITNHKSTLYTSMRDINAIWAKPHYEDAGGGTVGLDAVSKSKYFPLLRGMVDTPIKGDQVLVCTFGGENYYIGPVNTINSPNWNPDHLNKEEVNLLPSGTIKQNKRITFDSLGLSKDFTPSPTSRMCKEFNPYLDFVSTGVPESHGDMLIEGRTGNSIRVGSRGVNPYIFISNGRPLKNNTESLADGTLISITSFGTLQEHFGKLYDIVTDSEIIGYTLPSDTISDNRRLVGGDLYNYGYNENQLLLHSDKITISAKKDGLFLSSFGNTIIGSGGSVHIYSNKETIIESSNIYLGKQATETEEPEPLLLGNKVTKILEDIVSILETMKVTGTIGTISGPPDPSTLAKIQQLKSDIQSSQHKSNYHFIEDNVTEK